MFAFAFSCLDSDGEISLVVLQGGAVTLEMSDLSFCNAVFVL